MVSAWILFKPFAPWIVILVPLLKLVDKLRAFAQSFEINPNNVEIIEQINKKIKRLIKNHFECFIKFKLDTFHLWLLCFHSNSKKSKVRNECFCVSSNGTIKRVTMNVAVNELITKVPLKY